MIASKWQASRHALKRHNSPYNYTPLLHILTVDNEGVRDTCQASDYKPIVNQCR